MFDYKSFCFICGDVCSEELQRKLNKDRRQVIQHVETTELKNSVLAKYEERADTEAKIVKGRVEGVLCLFAAEVTTVPGLAYT